MLAFAFGLVHGFGFSFALRESLQFAGSHLLTSLLSFNAGVELGQLLVLALMVPALQLLFRFVVAERIGAILLSALVAHTAWHWTADRWGSLRQFAWPAFDAAALVSLVRFVMVLTVAVRHRVDRQRSGAGQDAGARTGNTGGREDGSRLTTDEHGPRMTTDHG